MKADRNQPRSYTITIPADFIRGTDDEDKFEIQPVKEPSF